MDKKDIKEKLEELIIELDLALQRETDDSNVFINCNDWYDLMRHCSKARNYWNQICDLEIWDVNDDDFKDSIKKLDSIIDDYESQIAQFKKACEEAKKGE